MLTRRYDHRDRTGTSTQPATGEGRRDALCVRRYTDFARRLVTTPEAPPSPAAQLMPMTISGRAYRGTVGSVLLAPAGQPVVARHPVSGAECGRTTVAGGGTYTLRVFSRDDNPRCFAAGERIAFQIEPAAARQTAEFVSNGNLMLDLGL